VHVSPMVLQCSDVFVVLLNRRVTTWNLFVLYKLSLLSVDVVLNIAGAEKIRSENLRLRSTWRLAIWVLDERSVSDGVLCGW